MRKPLFVLICLLTAGLLTSLPVCSAVEHQSVATVMEKNQSTIIELLEFIIGLLITGGLAGGTLYVLGQLYDLPSEVTGTYFALYMMYFIMSVIWRHLTFGFADM